MLHVTITHSVLPAIARNRYRANVTTVVSVFDGITELCISAKKASTVIGINGVRHYDGPWPMWQALA